MLNKRGISGVVVTVILIAMAVGLVAIVWVVVAGMINEGLGGAVSGSSRVSLGFDDSGIKATATGYSIIVERKTGEGELAKIKFILVDSEGESKAITHTSSMGESETSKFNFGIELFGEGNLKDLAEVRVIPIVLIGENEKELSSTDTLKITSLPITSENNLVGHWNFDNTFGDSSGLGNTGVNSGGVTFVEDSERGTVGDFDGSSYVELSKIDSISDGVMSMTAWVKIEESAGAKWIFHVENNALIQEDSNNLLIRSQVPGDTTDVGAQDKTIPLNEWHFVAGIFSSAEIVAYFDGEEYDKKSESVKTGVNSDGYNIGSRRDNIAFITGQMDDVRIYDKALTDAEVRLIYMESVN